MLRLLPFALALQACTVIPDSPTGVALATEASRGRTLATHHVEGQGIDARVGDGFGVEYRGPPERQDGLKAIVFIPAPRLPDPRNRRVVLQSEWTPDGSDGTCHAMHNVEEASERVAGVWRIGRWRNGERFASIEVTLAI